MEDSWYVYRKYPFFDSSSWTSILIISLLLQGEDGGIPSTLMSEQQGWSYQTALDNLNKEKQGSTALPRMDVASLIAAKRKNLKRPSEKAVETESIESSNGHDKGQNNDSDSNDESSTEGDESESNESESESDGDQDESSSDESEEEEDEVDDANHEMEADVIKTRIGQSEVMEENDESEKDEDSDEDEEDAEEA